MGLTIHYSLRANTDSEPRQLVEQMRQRALDLPFEEVGEIVDLAGKECNYEARRKELQSNETTKDETLLWLLIQAGKSVECPWNKRISMTVNPTRVIAFNAWPGDGCEAANFGLCLYPVEVEWEYKVEDDQRFEEKTNDNGWRGQRFSWRKWDRHCKRNSIDRRSFASHIEMRKVPTKLGGWRWGSFCKTQYASESQCGGIPNFLRCHISVITLLDRIAKISGLRVRVDDEGKYGPSTYSDDYKEAYAAGRKPRYRRHKGRYSPALLAQEVGQWNEMIAAFAGSMGDALAGSEMHLDAPIKDFADFERLEFRGRNQKHLAPFLQAMTTLAKATPEPVGAP